MSDRIYLAECKKWGIFGVLWVSLVGLDAGAQSVMMDMSTDAGRRATVAALREQSETRKMEAVSVAQARGWPVRGRTQDGRAFEIARLDPESGRPLYNITMNANAAISTAVNLVRGSAPFNVDGSGLLVGVWDAGSVRSDHQEFVSPNRVIVKDGSSHDEHATHVGGTIGAKGVNADAMGMAPAVMIHSYDWDADASEMVAEAATAAGQTNKINISNHSYGLITGWAWGSWAGSAGWHFFGTWSDREDKGFGQYGSEAVTYDNILYAAPYYLPFKAAGNDRNEGPYTDNAVFRYNGSAWVSEGTYQSATHPYRDGSQNGGYDTIGYVGNAKNIMTVGAVRDAVSLGLRNLQSAEMTSFSGWGPSDDGRIKPDIVANGHSVVSSVNSSTSAYSSFNGTSMATPNAAGSALLLVEYYRDLFPGGDMLASTLKGLIIHTADDIGTAGPDYQNGWGLMDTLAAAEQIQRHASATGYSAIVESVLNGGTASESIRFRWDGSNSIRATICWTDPAGTAQSGLNVTTPALVNDLDIRLVGPDGTTNFPFVLDGGNPGNAATTGDNILDNVEQILVASPQAGTYTLTVSHKGSLTNGEQVYSLLLSGSADMAIAPPKAAQTITFSLPAGAMLTDVLGLTASASSGLPVTLAVDSGPGVLNGTNLSFTATGTVRISASQAGNATYDPATTVYRDVVVSKVAQTIGFALASQAKVTEVLTLSASASSGLPVTLAVVSGPGVLNGTSLSFTATGTVRVAASQAGNATYAAASTVNRDIVVLDRTPQTITFTLASQVRATEVLTLSASASSGLPVTLAVVSGPGVLNGASLAFTGTGMVRVSASQAGDATYAPAPAVSRDIQAYELGQDPFSFRAVALNNAVSLRWTDPYASGMSNQTVLIRYATNTFPQSQSDGTELFRGVSTNFFYQHTNLAPRTTYFYSIWTSTDGVTFQDPPR